MQNAFLITTVLACKVILTQSAPTYVPIRQFPTITPKQIETPPSAAQKPPIVTAAQVNGTWQSRQNTFKILALGPQKLKVEFSGVYEYKSPAGPMANEGQGSGIATIDGNTALFRPVGAEDECRIEMRFTGGKMVVKQLGICGFGNHLLADGTYRKVSNRKPKFGTVDARVNAIVRSILYCAGEQSPALTGSVEPTSVALLPA
jgi:hypothetical protein